MYRRQVILTAALALVLALGAAVASADSKAVIVSVEGMHCKACVSSVEKKLKATEGVEEVRVSLEKGEAWIKFDDAKTDAAKLREAINSTGFKAGEVRTGE